MMKKIIAILSAMTISAGILLPQTVTASAADTTADTLPYDFYFEPERTSVSAAEVAAGDVVIPTPMYLYGSTANKITAVSVKYNSSSDHVYFQDMITGTTQLDATTSYETSLGTLNTNYMPYCFGKLHPNGKYLNGSAMITTKQFACDPIYGSMLYSTGDGGVKFTALYKPSKDADKISKEFICDVTVDENGNGTYSFEYLDQTSFLPRTASATIPRYDATLPEGSKIPDACNSVLWVPGTADLKEGAAFFGNASNEFPLFQINTVIQQGTPCGIYNISFSRNMDGITGADCQLLSGNKKECSINLIDTSIAVGVKSVTVTSVDMNEYALYASHDTHVITGADFAAQILADITYEDGTTEQNVDITNLVTCSGATPAELYASAENHCFISDVPLYVGDTPVMNGDGSNLTQHILVGMKGDVDFNGKVEMIDAYNVLIYNSKVSLGQSPVFCESPIDPYQETLAFFLADVDTCSDTGKAGGSISMNDAYYVLMYNSYQSLGQKVSWSGWMN